MLIALALAAALLAPPDVPAGPIYHSPDEVLLVCNKASAISKSIGDEYSKKRHIKYRISIDCPDSAIATRNETISLTTYKEDVETPIRAVLSVHPGINFLVLTKGVPIRVVGAPIGSCDENSREPLATRGRPALDSLLASMDYDTLKDTRLIPIAGSGAKGAGYINRYWNAAEPFSHAKFGGYLVTRLDGYTLADSIGLINKALISEASMSAELKQGAVLLDAQPIFGMGDKATQPGPIIGDHIGRESDYSEFNADMVHAHDILTERQIPDELDTKEEFVGDRANLLGYFSWGSNDSKYKEDAYESLKFAPGSISDTAVSTSGRTFLPTEGGQSLLTDLIAHGLTCGKGYVDEPLLQAIASPTITLDRYTAGYTMAESLYAASHFVGWEDVVIGDPLCAPFYKAPKLAAPAKVPTATKPQIKAGK